MDNRFFVDGKHLSPSALEKKHRIENEPSSRTNHMEYMEGMERIKSDIMEKVLSEMNSYDYSQYTAKDVKAALEHESCTIEFCRLPQNRFWSKWHSVQGLKQASTSATLFICLRRCILPIIAKITAFTAALTATTT